MNSGAVVYHLSWVQLPAGVCTGFILHLRHLWGRMMEDSGSSHIGLLRLTHLCLADHHPQLRFPDYTSVKAELALLRLVIAVLHGEV